MAEVMELERAELGAAKQTVKTQRLTIEKLEHRLARLLRVQFGRSPEKMDIAQLRLMLEEVDGPEPANDDATMASDAKPMRKAGTRAPVPAHMPRQTTQHLPQPCGCGGKETVICEDVSEVLDYVPACFHVLRHVRPRIACRSCETIRQAPAIDLPLPKGDGKQRIARCEPLRRSSTLASPIGDPAPASSGDRSRRDGRWSQKLAWLMAPLGERLLAHILEAPKIHGEETPVTLLHGEDGSHTAYFWVYLRDRDISPPAVAFRFTTGRGGKHRLDQRRKCLGAVLLACRNVPLERRRA